MKTGVFPLQSELFVKIFFRLAYLPNEIILKGPVYVFSAFSNSW